jgi:hypothetical protein
MPGRKRDTLERTPIVSLKRILDPTRTPGDNMGSICWAPMQHTCGSFRSEASDEVVVVVQGPQAVRRVSSNHARALDA